MHKIAPLHIFLALFFLIILLPFVPNLSYDYHNSQRLFQFILLISSLLFFSKMKLRLVKVDSEIKYAFGIFIALNIASALLSSFNVSSFFNVLHYIALGYLVLSICQLNKKNLKTIWISLFLAHSVLISFCFMNLLFTLIERSNLSAHLIYMKFDNIRHFNHIQLLVLPFSLYLIRNKKYRTIVFLLISINLLLLFIGGSLAVLLLLPLIFLLLYLLNLRTYLNAYLYSILLSLLFYLCICLYLPISENEASYFSSSGRFEMWWSSISEGLNLFSGIGPGNYSYRMNTVVLSHPHNSIIQIFVESGILSGILIIFILGKIFWVQLNNRYDGTESEKVYFLTFICWVVYSLVSGVMVMPVTQVIGCLLLGPLMCVTKCHGLEVTKWNKFYLLLFSAVYSIMFYCSFIQLNADTPKMAGPSFWSAGEKNLQLGIYEK
jgi:hypothetical protein